MSPKKSSKKSKRVTKVTTKQRPKMMDSKKDSTPIQVNEKYVNHQGVDIVEKELITITEIESLIATPIPPKMILNENTLGFIVNDYHIIELNVIRTKLAELPASIENLKHLTSLNLKFNQLSQLHPNICNLTNIENLSLDGNQLKSLPLKFGNLQKLIKLSLNDNQITRLPESFGDLNLQKLTMAGNKLISLFQSFGHIKSLVYLDLHYNQLKKLPDTFENLVALQTINLERNQFEFLPDSICKLECLEAMYLAKNQLSYLPHHFGNLKKIAKLNISDNQFITIPSQIGYLTEIRDLNLQNNPLDGESKLIASRDLQSIRNWCLQRADIHIFLSHAVIDNNPYRLDEIERFLERCPGIYEIFCCEKNLVGDIDKFMQEYIPKSQLFLFLATKNSIFKSKDCKYEIELARKQNLEIIPIKTSDVSWEDLAVVGLSREFAIKYDPSKFDEFCDKLYQYISRIRKTINLFEKDRANFNKKLLTAKNTITNFLETDEFRQIFLEDPKYFEEVISKLAKLEITQQDFVKIWAKRILQDQPDPNAHR